MWRFRLTFLLVMTSSLAVGVLAPVTERLLEDRIARSSLGISGESASIDGARLRAVSSELELGRDAAPQVRAARSSALRTSLTAVSGLLLVFYMLTAAASVARNRGRSRGRGEAVDTISDVG